MNTGSEQDLLKIDGMEGSRSAGARLASVRMDKPGAFEWMRFTRALALTSCAGIVGV